MITQSLKNIIWQSRNQSIHHEDGNYHNNVKNCFIDLQNDFGNDFEVGLRGFIGVEYFFAPKMSVGGEFYWGVSYVTTGESSVTFEGYEGSTNEVMEYTTFTKGNRDLEVGFRNTSASVNVFFYF